MKWNYREIKCGKKNGFSLIELMMVIMIAGIVLGIGLPKMREVQMAHKAAYVKMELMNLKTAIGMFKATTGQYPHLEYPEGIWNDFSSVYPYKNAGLPYIDRRGNKMPGDIGEPDPSWNLSFRDFYPADEAPYTPVGVKVDMKKPSNIMGAVISYHHTGLMLAKNNSPYTGGWLYDFRVGALQANLYYREYRETNDWINM